MENITAGNEAQGIEDMIHLDTMSEETILKNLGVRYSRDQIYTYTGAILVSVNPYQALPIYTAEVAKRYNNKPLGDVEPHIFAIADVAYQTMMEDGGNRSVIISGESGAGKTEATKLLLQYLALKTSGVNKAHSAPETANKKKSLIEQLILESSPILEAFGNAKTVRNDNSSRFGKYMKIDFDPRGSIAGAKIENYLLEKSRIVYQAQDERNYHIFYQFCAGLSPEEKERYKVGAATDFHYINQSGCHTIPHVDDANDFSEVRNALSVLGIGPEEDIWAVVAAVLHMGNIRFAPQGDGSTVVNTDSLQHVATNLGVSAEKLAESMTVRYNKIRNEVFRVPLKPEEAADVRDAIAKALYGRQFNWLVERINRSISKSASTNARSFIGVLDIFGFENFTVNSFEQLCINYANEKLQQQFNQHIFKQEQEEYEREKISWETISFNDNQGCIDLIEKPLGVLSLLDEECFFPKGSDGTFLEKLNKAHEKHTYYEKPKTRGDKFVIRHYAGDVAYSTKSFLDKNRDTIPESASALLAGASIAHVAQLFPEGMPAAQAQAAQGGRGGKGRSPTVGAQFKNQLLDLVATLSATYPYYVRCLKPNPQKKPSLLDNDMVLAQLRYCGMLETIRIRKLGFPIRREFVAFRDRYRLLAPSSAWEKDDRKACSMILDAASYRMTPGHYTLGLTKVFMRDEQSTILEQLRNEHLLASVLLIQKTWRCYAARSHFAALRKGALTAQTHYRKRVARVEYTRLRDASITIQTWTRMVFARRKFLTIRKGALAMQAAARTMLAIKEKERLVREEQERQRRLEEIRQLKDKQERERREQEELLRQEQERKQKVEKEKQEKERQEKEKREMEKLREEAQRRDQAALGLPASETLADYQAIQRGATVQNFAEEEVPAEAQTSLDSESLEEAWLHALDPLNVPPPDWDLPPAPEGLPPPPPAQAGILDFLSTPLYGYHFKDFATRHFRPHKTDTIQQLITYTKKPLSASLLQLNIEDAKNAVEVSRKIHIYMTHKKTLAENLSVVQYVLQRGLSVPDLRDEIYCQLIKQVTGNPTPEYEEHCWELIVFCCCTFAPVEFLKYFVCFLDEAAASSPFAAHAVFAKESLTRLLTTSERKLVPSLMELEAIRKREPMMLRVFFLDGTVKALLLDSAATVAELKQQIVTKLQMQFAKGFALYKSYSQIERLMEDEEKMSDELASFEQLRSAMGDQQLRMRILFKKRLYFTDDVPNPQVLDKSSLDLLFAQATEDIRTGRLPTTREVVLKLAGLKLHSDIGDYNGEPVDDKQTGVYIPAYIRYKFQQEDWSKVMATEQKTHTGRSERDVRIDYLKIVSQLPLYGAALFAMELQNNIINLVRDQGYLAISGRGVCFVTRDQKGEVVMTSYLPYEDILNWECTPTTTSLTLSLGTRREVLDLKCEQSSEVERLLRDYTGILAASSEWARAISDYETEDPSLLSFRQGDVINVKEKDEFSGWYKGFNFANGKEGAFPRDLVKMLVARPKTTETGRKKAPTQSTYLTTRMAKSNRLSVARGPESDAAAVPDVQTAAAGASVETSKFRTQMEVKGTSIFRSKKLEQVSVSQLLSFAAQPIKASLVQLLPEASKQAVEMFQLVMKYMGDYPTRLSQSKYDALPAKTIQMAIDNRELRDELYCQLMKQTNKNPRDSSNEKGWELLALCAGCFLPQDEMLDRLYKRLEEHEQDAKVGYYAKQAVDRLQNTILVGERELAPSHAELTALRNRSRIMCRVALPNGSHRAVLVDAWTTVGDVVPEVIRQLRFQNQPKSFGLFEITPQAKNEIRLKVPLADDMFVCDALARWEKAQKKDKNNSSNRIPDAPLEMRKKLFFPLEQDDDLAISEEDDMLADFLFSQVCEDFLSGQLPASHKDIAKLGACLLHIRFRASDSSASINSGVLSEIVGKSLANKKEAQQITAEVEEAYGEFAGLPIITAKRSFLGVASNLPLYGAALFPARQNEHPQSVWFAVSSKGVSIVEADHPHGVYKFWSYREVANWGNTKQNFHLVAGNLQKPEKRSFTSAYSAHISAMYACFTSRPGDTYLP